MTKPAYWDSATRALSDADTVLAKLIGNYPGVHMTRRNDAFTALCRAIVGQQISVKAAEAIWRRLIARSTPEAADAAFPALDAARIVRLPPDALREIGLSERKAGYVRDLAAHLVERRLDPAAWAALDDEALIEALCDVKGIGRWTAEMFLMFHELRPDVLPVDDIGLQKALRCTITAAVALP